MTDETFSVGERSTVSIPLRNLFSLVATVAAAVWAYSVLEGRIAAIENKELMLADDIRDLQQASRDAATGVDPWATDVQQTTRIDRVERDVKRIEETYLASRNGDCAL